MDHSLWSEPVGSRSLCEFLAVRYTVILGEFGGGSVTQVCAVLQTAVVWLSRNRSLHFPRNNLYNRIMEIVIERLCDHYNTHVPIRTSQQTLCANQAQQLWMSSYDF
jgi:hypothetical protein